MGQKTEISNICFYSFSKKRKILIQQIKKRRGDSIFFKEKTKKNIRWEFDRKLFSLKVTLEKPFFMIVISSINYLYPEAILFLKDIKLRGFYEKNIMFSQNFKLFTDKFEFLDLLIYIHLEAWNFVSYRFGLHKINLIKPVFICFSEQKKNFLVVSILNLCNYQSFSFPISLTILTFRLKPGILKIVTSGDLGLLFFSLNFGFSYFCPIFIKKKQTVSKKVQNKKFVTS
jgi:hypothetical protein